MPLSFWFKTTDCLVCGAWYCGIKCHIEESCISGKKAGERLLTGRGLPFSCKLPYIPMFRITVLYVIFFPGPISQEPCYVKLTRNPFRDCPGCPRDLLNKCCNNCISDGPPHLATPISHSKTCLVWPSWPVNSYTSQLGLSLTHAVHRASTYYLNK